MRSRAFGTPFRRARGSTRYALTAAVAAVSLAAVSLPAFAAPEPQLPDPSSPWTRPGKVTAPAVLAGSKGAGFPGGG
ncbi:hypothetical protein [Streptomyces niveus]|uniref:hypothetical protein n=1 Tax=Streptomyces niveus TaxID=193462 RepID=UPI0033F01640